jgi:alkylation response protein AidB-like acyl-CoA dehydrogenase
MISFFSCKWGVLGNRVGGNPEMGLSPQQLSIQAMAADFVRRELRPVVGELECGDNLTLLKTLWQKMALAGLVGLPYPEAIGGVGTDSLSYFLVLEEIAKVSAALATSLSVHVSLVGLPLLAYGSPAQQAQYLPDLISGKRIGAFALTEANAGSDAGAGLTRARPDGDVYVLNGSKVFITNALIADVFIATARTIPDQPGSAGLSAFLIDRDTPGFHIAKGDEKMGLLGSDWGELVFEDCRIPSANRLANEGEGFKLFMKSLNTGRIGIAFISLGLAEACLSASIDSIRRMNPAKPESQGLQFKLATMATKIEAARQLSYNAARLKDAGASYAQAAAMAKLYASETANACARDALQIVGYDGYVVSSDTPIFPVERYFRDARVMSLFEGTSEIQRIVIAKHLLNS